jgi:hypothetical protein
MQKSSSPRGRGRPRQFNRRLLLAADDQTVTAIETAAADEDDKPSRSEMIRRIVTDWLRQHGYMQR